ncbi:MAG: hypothetical protein COW42_16650 [Deltaproteobacteria bacterium CG17_big_fil_post_rev_8_21_14_2_50_63_7]|nr:MAG: hypothetical protein COW42_16650 [Deltaproteobacteria bacterium CG17_big_fil_post_rev_8_21_14_2_50_63_7]
MPFERVTSTTFSLLLLVASVLFVAPAQAGCPDETEALGLLDDAEGFYVTHQYELVTQTLDPLINPEQCFKADDKNIEAQLLLGVAQFELGELGMAELAFLGLLRRNPDYRIEEGIPIPKSAASYLEEVRKNHDEELQELRSVKGGGVVIETVYVTVEEQKGLYFINFLPFGAGQFQNDELALGMTFLTLEVVTATASLLGYFAIEYIRGATFEFTAKERAVAENWQTLQLASAGAFYVLYVTGVVLALTTYEPSRRSFLPPTTDKPEEGLSWFVTPAAEGAGASVLLQWPF